jgi:hypothetical protein
MNSMLFNLLDQRTCLRLTETLLHFVWQGLVIGLCAVCVAWLCRTASSRTRYGIHAISLALMALCVPVTFVVIGLPELPQGKDGSVVVVEPVSFASLMLPEVITGSISTAPVDGANPSAPASDVLSTPAPIADPVAPKTSATRAARESPFVSTLRQGAPYAVWAYFLGFLGMVVRLCCALWGGHRLRRCAIPVSDQKFLKLIRKQASLIGLKFVPVVEYCERITIPVVAGVLRVR